MIAGAGGGQEAVREIVEWLGGDLGQFDLASLRPARHLPPRRMKLAVAHQHAQRFAGAARASGNEADQEVMGVRRRIQSPTDRRCPSSRGDMRLRFGPDLAHHLVPFMVGQPRRIFPAFDLALERGVGPEMMAVGGEMEPIGRRAEAFGEQRLEAQSHRSSGTIIPGRPASTGSRRGRQRPPIRRCPSSCR